MVEEIKRNNAEGRLTRWILPCGPMKQYGYFIKTVNEQKISLRDLHIFHMDNCLDWQGRPLVMDHPFNFEGIMRRDFYALIDPDLANPESQRYFPNIYALEQFSESIVEVGGIDTAYGGVGFRGHIAFNDLPDQPGTPSAPQNLDIPKHASST